MAKVITLRYEWTSNPHLCWLREQEKPGPLVLELPAYQTIVKSASEMLARVYSDHPGADFGIVDSNDFALGISAHSFYEEEIANALGKYGIKNVGVRGIARKSFSELLRQITGDVSKVNLEFLCQAGFCDRLGQTLPLNIGEAVLYGFEKKEK